MSDIFDLFGSMNSRTGNQSKQNTELMANPMRQRSLSDNGRIGLKNATIVGSKPRGLSLRRQVDPNICNTNSSQVTDQNALLKPTLKSSVNNSNTPRKNKEKSKLLTVRAKQRKGLSPVTKSPHSKYLAQKQTDEFKFKKPMTPRQIQKDTIFYPEPEKLAYYSDEKIFDPMSLDKGFSDLIISRKCVTPFEDEGFISDPEPLNVASLSPINLQDSKFNDFDEITMTAPEIPTISDDEDYF